MIRAFKQTTKKEETAALFSLVISLVALDGSDSCALHVNFSVVHFLIHVVLVFSHVAVGIDARATYRVRVVYIYLVPRVLRISLLHLPLLFWVCNNPLLSTAFVSKE